MGFIHDKLDRKILLLYLLSRTAGPIDCPTLTELAACDPGADYFGLAEAAAELLQSGHIVEENGLFSITEKGRRNCVDAESSLAAVVRKKCDQQLLELNAALRRCALVRASVSEQENGFLLQLVLNDDVGNLLTLSLTTASREQGEQMAQKFRANPEEIYHGILRCLLPSDEKGTNS